ncbi:MAG TPA: ATP-binding protein [Steroidobacteraceae bacterium]|jgi:signal transduction histidine kinase|nr:ATP-binding protein [Steroidobacteraceae bacterium]
MLERLRLLWHSLWPDPARTSLTWWLVAIHMCLVLLVAGGITWTASRMLHALADEQGKARAQLAATTAREDLRRLSEDAHAAAQALAERPTLQRLLAEGQSEALPPLLRRTCEASGFDACAVLNGKTVIAVSGPALDWQQVVTAAAEQGATFLALPATGRVPLLGARTAFGDQGLTVYAVRRLDERLAKSLSVQVGAEVRLIDYRTYTNGPVSAFTPLYSAALADGHSAVQRIEGQEVYAAAVPVFASSGEAIALIEALLPVSVADSSLGRLRRRLLVTALILAGIAVFAGVLLGERVAGPVRALTAAATRIGAGDFSVSIPPGGAAEVGALAHTMEDMRRNLIELTSTLRRREAEAQALLGGIVEGVYAVDKNREIRYLNAQAARLLGVTPEQAVGRFCGDVLKPRDQDGRRLCDVHCPILQARSDGTAKAVEQLAAGGGDLRTTVITSAAPVEGLQVQVIRDETELEAVRRARDSVLANISHEFRTPLAAQLASIELLLDGLDHMPRPQQRELVSSLERGTLRLTQLIDNLLESVRIESGQLAIRQQSVALAEVIEDAQALVGSLLAQRRQRLTVSLPEELPPVNGDKTRLTQVFVNLLANANKFAPEDSVIWVGAEASPGVVRAWVEDEGPGPLAASEELFARFRRGGEPEPAGLGLGLWLVKSIIERHGGSVAFERTAAGRTRFTLTLPVEARGPAEGSA